MAPYRTASSKRSPELPGSMQNILGIYAGAIENGDRGGFVTMFKAVRVGRHQRWGEW